MFKSFFPKPGPFFLSAFIWALIAVIFWQAGGGAWLTRITGATGEVPISAARFWSLSYLLFYAYYMVCVGLFALFWFMYSPHRWQYWSIRHIADYFCYLVPRGGGRGGERLVCAVLRSNPDRAELAA